MLIPEVGTRVVVRYRLPAGASHLYSDVTGDLVQTGEGVTVAGRRGDITLALSDIVAIKPIPPRPVAGRDIRDLESAAARGWPGLESATIDGWLLRAGSGFTTRANCALALNPQATLGALAQITDWYAARGLQVQLQVVKRLLPAPPSWRQHRATSMLSAPLAALNRAPITMTLRSDPSAQWLSLFRAGTAVTTEAIEVVKAVEGEVVFGEYYLDGQLAAIGRAAVTVSDSGIRWLGLSSLEVAAPYRRRGIGTALMNQLSTWGAQRDAVSVYLQVMAENAGARVMYEAMGYTEHHTYHYATPTS